jgi:hypothetical protein
MIKPFFGWSLEIEDVNSFINHWSLKYTYKDDWKYNDNIGKPLTEERIILLYEWKNGGVISKPKQAGVLKNYAARPPEDLEKRYLNAEEEGGAIWNIFYLHINDQDKWPIYDQHAYRTMKYLQEGIITEISMNKEEVYRSYLEEYIPFFNSLGEGNKRERDKALFACGRFLKAVNRFS